MSGKEARSWFQSKRLFTISTDYAIAVVLAILSFLIFSSRAASTPQSADGCELVLTTLNGGLLHPPGFSIQAGIYRILAQLFRLNSPLAFSLLGQLALSLSTALIYLDVRLGLSTRYRINLFSRNLVAEPELAAPSRTAGLIAGLLSVACPSIVGVASQPELFALGFLWFALGPFLPFGIWLGLVWHIHPVALLGIFRARIPETRRDWVKHLGLTTIFFVLGSALLLSYQSPSTWPNWGSLDSIGQLLDHLTRREFGMFQLASSDIASSKMGLNGLKVLLDEILRYQPILLLTPLFFLLALIAGPRSRILPNALSAFAGILLLSMMRLPVDDPYYRAILERFVGFVLPALVITFVITANWALRFYITRETARVVARPILMGVAYAFALLVYSNSIYALATSLRLGDHRQDNTLEVFRHVLAKNLKSLPEGTLYLASQAEEYFCGVPVAPSMHSASETEVYRLASLRFPVLQGLFLHRPWYVLNSMAVADPRLLPLSTALKKNGFRALTTSELLEAVFGSNRRLDQLVAGEAPTTSLSAHTVQLASRPQLASLDAGIFSSLGLPSEEHGVLLSTSSPGASSSVGPPNQRALPRRLQVFCEILPLLSQLKPLPSTHFGYSYQLRRFLARAAHSAQVELMAATPAIEKQNHQDAILVLKQLTSFLYEGESMQDSSPKWEERKGALVGLCSNPLSFGYFGG